MSIAMTHKSLLMIPRLTKTTNIQDPSFIDELIVGIL
jgi:hypothetical protein